MRPGPRYGSAEIPYFLDDFGLLAALGCPDFGLDDLGLDDFAGFGLIACAAPSAVYAR